MSDNLPDDFVGVPRRRRRSSGGRMSDASRAEGVNDIVSEFEQNLNEQVRKRVQAGNRPEAADPHDVSVKPSAEDSPEFTPSSRLDEVKSGSSRYEREYRLRLLHRLLMRNVPLDEIAKELKVSVSTVIRDRDVLYKRLREEAQKLDINEIVGDTLGFYTEVGAMSLRIASMAKQPTPSKLAALRTALAAKNDMHRFLQASGVYDVLQYRAKESGSDRDIQALMEITMNALQGEEDVVSSQSEQAEDDDNMRLY